MDEQTELQAALTEVLDKYVINVRLRPGRLLGTMMLAVIVGNFISAGVAVAVKRKLETKVSSENLEKD